MEKRNKTYSVLEKISRRAMKSQLVSHRIEGINISKKDAEKIRREVLQEYYKTKRSPKLWIILSSGHSSDLLLIELKRCGNI